MRSHLTHSGAVVSINPADYILQSHTMKTILVIERVVEFAEDAREPFTRSECWHACFGHYSVVSSTILSLKRAGLILCVNPGRSPQRLISVDRIQEWEETRNARLHSLRSTGAHDH